MWVSEIGDLIRSAVNRSCKQGHESLNHSLTFMRKTFAFKLELIATFRF